MRSQAGVPGRSGVPGGQIGMIQIARALPAHGHQVSLFVGGPRMAYFDGLNDVPPMHAFPRVPSVAPYDVNGLSEHIADALRGELPPADKTRIRDYAWSSIAGNYSDLYPAARRRSGSTASR